jgi:transcriptional regulator of acetoin/glycerol metabolism
MAVFFILENNEIQKVGAESCTNVDVRVIAASHKNLKEEVQQGHFQRVFILPHQRYSNPFASAQGAY